MAKYIANVGFWKGRTAVVFASGFLGGDSPAFEPWVALDNGGTFPLAVDNFKPENPPADFLVANNTLETVIFPNPAATDLNLRVNGLTGDHFQVSIVNLLGQTLLVRQFDGNLTSKHTFNFDSSTLKDGSYFMRLQDGQRMETIPFQVAK